MSESPSASAETRTPVHGEDATAAVGPVDNEHELLATLFRLGREVTSVLDLDELLAKIPELIATLTTFTAFAMYLLEGDELRIAYSVGYPEDVARSLHFKLGQGVVGTSVQEGRPILVNDVTQEPRFRGSVPGALSQLAVPIRRKGKVVGALNLLSDRRGAFTPTDEMLLRQFAAHVAVAIENARLFESERAYTQTLETLADIGREMTSILEPSELLRRIAHLTRRLIDYRTFGILLVDEDTQRLDLKHSIRYGDTDIVKNLRVGEGIVGYAALHKVPVLVGDVSRDPRYIKVVDDARSELAIPLIYKDRCIGVFDLESPELNAFTKAHVELLTLLASQAAIAIENARLYDEVHKNEIRIEKELRFAQRVQTALLPTDLPIRPRGVDIAARFVPARELGGDLYDLLAADANGLVVAVGDVSGKGVPAALYGAYAGELVRSRTAARRRYAPDRFTAGDVLKTINTILHQRQLEEYYCTLCYAIFDFKRRSVTMANSGLPYPIRWSEGGCSEIELPGVPLGSFPESTYDEVSLKLHAGDVFLFCSDGVSDMTNEATGQQFGASRLIEIVSRTHQQPAREIVDAIFAEVTEFRGETPQTDDMTAVVLKMAG